MANNRLYLKCAICGKKFFLGKTFLDGYYNAITDMHDLNKFFNEHKYCYEGESECFSDGDFRLEYEFSWDCQWCNKPIDPEDKFCRHCGKPI